MEAYTKLGNDMAKDWRILIDDTGWPTVVSDADNRCVFHPRYPTGVTPDEAAGIAKLVLGYMNRLGHSEPIEIVRPNTMRRFNNLAGLVAAKKGAERQRIVKTLVKMLDECNDAEYDAVTDDVKLLAKLIAAGIEFDDEIQEPTADSDA
jgi:hypothetical protein